MAVMIEARSYRPFKSSEEYLYAMKEDLAEWLNLLYPELMINVDNFMDRLDSGVALCKHANNVRDSAIDHEAKRVARGLLAKTSPLPLVSYFPAARPATFFARDNVSNFITWSRNALKIFECLLFETDDLIMRKNEKHVILCLLEVARKGSKFGMLAPMLVQMEKQIDREIMADARRAGQGVLDSEEEEDDSSAHDAPPMVYGPMPQIVTNDLKSLDEMVRDLVERCNCPTQFPMIRVSEGKYRIGDTKVLIFVRILRSHVMVRVGGGWDTLSHYLDKHDPCRCKAQHRTTHAARVVQRYPPAVGCMDLNGAEVHYERSPPRTRRSSVSSVGSSGGGSPQHLPSQLGPPQNTAARQRSRSPANRGPTSLPHMGNAFENQAFNHLTADNAYYQSKLNRRSASPSPARKLTPHSRVPSPKPVHKKSITQNSTPHLATQPESFSNPSLVHSDSLVPNPHRNYRSRSPTPRIATNGTDNKVNSPDKDVMVNGVYDNQMYTEGVTTMDGVGNGSENASDNGSEVSDEGYRSLGLIQNTSGSTQASPPSASSMTKDSSDRGLGLKLNRFSIGSQASTEDADILERPDTLSGNETPYKSLDSGTRLYEERMRNEEIASMNSKIDRLRNPPHEEVSSITGLRKTNYSETLYGDKKTPATKVEKTHSRNASTPPICLDNNDSPSKSLQKSATSSKIPQSPVLTRRRLSVENLSPQNRSRSASYDRSAKRDKSLNRDTPSPTKRSSPAVKSPKDAASKPPTVPANSPTGGNVGSFGKTGGNKIASASGNNTWNGRTPIPKGKTRPGLSNETFVSPAQNRNHSSKISSPSFQRNTNLRASTTALRNMAGYDHNGRKIKTPPNSSPTKTAKQTRSPLLEKILKSAENVHDDLMVLEAVKDIIKQYTFNDKSDTIKNCCEDDVYSDFTSAWVHSNGALERSQSTKQLTETHSSPSQDTVSNDSNENGSGLKSTALVSKIPMFTPRKDSKAGITSRIPAPVSASAYKKSTDVCD